MVGVRPGPFNHAFDTEVLVEPGLDLVVKNSDLAWPFSLSGLFVGRFAEDPGHAVPVTSYDLGNLGIGVPFLFEMMCQ